MEFAANSGAQWSTRPTGYCWIHCLRQNAMVSHSLNVNITTSDFPTQLGLRFSLKVRWLPSFEAEAWKMRLYINYAYMHEYMYLYAYLWMYTCVGLCASACMYAFMYVYAWQILFEWYTGGLIKLRSKNMNFDITGQLVREICILI
jgi:hypothetical protein